MNTNTGEIYRGDAAIQAARERGEPIAEVSERVARAVETGLGVMNRAERRRQMRAEGKFKGRQP